jgi:hypothetical protein
MIWIVFDAFFWLAECALDNGDTSGARRGSVLDAEPHMSMRADDEGQLRALTRGVRNEEVQNEHAMAQRVGEPVGVWVGMCLVLSIAFPCIVANNRKFPPYRPKCWFFSITTSMFLLAVFCCLLSGQIRRHHSAPTRSVWKVHHNSQRRNSSGRAGKFTGVV